MVQQEDDIIWNVLGSNFCSYKVRTHEKFEFCRNPYNVTGQCNRESCPLANSKYATVREIDGKLNLFTKNKQFQHCPAKMWSSIELPQGKFEECCEFIEEKLAKYSRFLKEKNKLRTGKYVECQARQEFNKNNPQQVKILKPRKTRVLRREKLRERKALKNALLDQKIENELVSRLKVGVYGDIYNLDEKRFNKALDRQVIQNEQEQFEEFVEEEEEESEDQLESALYSGDDDGDDEEEYKDLEDYEKRKHSKTIKEYEEYEDDIEDIIPSSSKRKNKVEIEYETEIPERLLIKNRR